MTFCESIKIGNALFIYPSAFSIFGFSNLANTIPKMYKDKPAHLSADKKNDGKMSENGQEQRGRNDGAPSRSLAGS